MRVIFIYIYTLGGEKKSSLSLKLIFISTKKKTISMPSSILSNGLPNRDMTTLLLKLLKLRAISQESGKVTSRTNTQI